MKRIVLFLAACFTGSLFGQEVTHEAIDSQVFGVREVIQYTISALEEWERTLYQKTKVEENAAYEKLMEHQRWSYDSLKATLKFEYDPGYLEAAIDLVEFMGEDERLLELHLNTYRYFVNQKSKDALYGKLESFKAELLDKMNAVTFRETQMVALLVESPITYEFCEDFYKMHQVASDSFVAIKGEHLEHLDDEYNTWFSAKQMYNGAESGTVRFDRTGSEATFVMKTFSDEAKATSYFQHLVYKILSCTENADYGRYSGSDIHSGGFEYFFWMNRVRTHIKLVFDKSGGNYVVKVEFETNR